MTGGAQSVLSVSSDEAALAGALRVHLASPWVKCGATDRSTRKLLAALETHLSSLLHRHHGGSQGPWPRAGLDDILARTITRTGPHAIMLLGVAVLNTDHGITPLQTWLRKEPEADKMHVIARIGEREQSPSPSVPGRSGPALVHTPYTASQLDELLHRVAHHVEQIDWAYTVRSHPETSSVDDSPSAAG